MNAYTRPAEAVAEFDALHPALAPDCDERTDKVIDAARAFVADAVLAELGLTQAELVAWRWPGGAWNDGRPYQSDMDELGRYGKAPEFAYAAPQPQPLITTRRVGCNVEVYVSGKLHTVLHAPPSPQVSAEDVAFVEACVKRYGDEVDWTAWQRIRADYERMGVGRD